MIRGLLNVSAVTLIVLISPLVEGVDIGVVGPNTQNLQIDRTEASANGLKEFYRAYGKLRISADAAGSNGTSHTVKILKPSADAVVSKAYLLAASNFYTTINDGDVTLNGNPVTWFDDVYNHAGSSTNFFHNVVADVTGLVKRRLNNAVPGKVSFSIAEVNNNSRIDGEVLVVVFNLPSLPRSQRRTVTLMFGGQRLNGDRFEISLESPIDTSDDSAHAQLGLGISFGCQASSGCSLPVQYSTVDVNGIRVSSAAGGQDDGSLATNGALITLGGRGDSKKNPADPFLIPGDTRDDDEYYNLLPYIDPFSTNITIDTANPSDDDNIFFAWFEFSAVGEINKDSDGDGLLDSWETHGYDHDGDGVVDVPLPDLGFDPMKKDIAVAYAWMKAASTETHSHRPKEKVKSHITGAFARAPVANPDGTTGIKLHWKDLGSVPHDFDLNPVWDEFDAIMSPLLTDAEVVIYHRGLLGHGYNGGASSGISRGIPASDFVETLGSFPSNPGTTYQRAGTIMHELGHNLGLRHGGGDHTNYKPNHLSVMSYLNQLDWLIRKGKPLLDYERFDLSDLDESSLDESAALTNNNSLTFKKYGTRWFSPQGNQASSDRGINYFADWDLDGTASPDVSVDLNGSRTLSTLRARYSEWEHLVYNGGSIGSSGRTEQTQEVSPERMVEDLTPEKYLQMRSNIIETQGVE